MTSNETLTEKQMDDKFKVFDKVVNVQDKTFYTKYVKPNQTVVVATLTFMTGFVAGYLTKSKSK